MAEIDNTKLIYIPGELRVDTIDGIVVGTDQVFDREFPTLDEQLNPTDEVGEDQETINKYLKKSLDSIIGTGGGNKTPFVQKDNKGIYANFSENNGGTKSFNISNGGISKGSNSLTQGTGTIANNPNEVALGKYNKPEENTIFSVGIGTDSQNRKNAFEIRENGDIYFGDNINLVNLLNELSNVFIKVSDPDDEEIQGIISCFAKINDELKKVGQGSVNLSKNGRSGGDYSLTVGDNTITSKIGEVALGQYNVSNENTIFSIGDGTSDDQRHNIFEIRVGSDNQFGIYFNDQDLYTLIKNISGLNPDDIANLNRLLQTKADLKDVPIIKNGSGIVIKESTKDGRPIKTILANLLDENPQDRNVESDSKYYPVEIDENGRLAVHIVEDIERISISINDQELKDKVTITYTITPTEGDSETNSFIWNGSNHIIEVPYGAQYNITASSVNGYSCSNPTFSGTADQSNVNHQFLYQKVTTIINRSSNQIDNLPAGTATLTWTENGTTKSQSINFSSGSNSIGVNGIPLNIPITIKYGEIDGYKKPNDVVITFTSSVTSNSDTGGGYKGCKVTLNTTSNQSSDVDIKNTYINIKYGNNTKTVNRNKSVMIPLDSTITCKFSEVSGYNKPQDVEYTLSETSKTISGEYKTTVVTLNMTGGDATFNITSTSMSQQKSLSSGESIKIPTGDIVTYMVGTIDGKQYTSNLSSGFIATGSSQTININFSEIQGATFTAIIKSNLDDGTGIYSQELQDFAVVNVWQYVKDSTEEDTWLTQPALYKVLKHNESVDLPLTYIDYKGNTQNYGYSYSYTPPSYQNSDGTHLSFGCRRPTPSAIFEPKNGYHYYSCDYISRKDSGGLDGKNSITKNMAIYYSYLYKVRIVDNTGENLFSKNIQISNEATIWSEDIFDLEHEYDIGIDQTDLGGMSGYSLYLGEKDKQIPSSYSDSDYIEFAVPSTGYVFLAPTDKTRYIDKDGNNATDPYVEGSLLWKFVPSYVNNNEFEYVYDQIINSTDISYIFNVTVTLGTKLEGIFPIDYEGKIYTKNNLESDDYYRIRNNHLNWLGIIVYYPSADVEFIVPKEGNYPIGTSSTITKKYECRTLFNKPLMEVFDGGNETAYIGREGIDLKEYILPTKINVHPNYRKTCFKGLSLNDTDVYNSRIQGVQNTQDAFESLTDSEKLKTNFKHTTSGQSHNIIGHKDQQYVADDDAYITNLITTCVYYYSHNFADYTTTCQDTDAKNNYYPDIYPTRQIFYPTCQQSSAPYSSDNPYMPYNGKINLFTGGYIATDDKDYNHYIYPKKAEKVMRQTYRNKKWVYVEYLQWSAPNHSDRKIYLEGSSPYIPTVYEWQYVLNNISTIHKMFDTDSGNTDPLTGLKNGTECFYTCQSPSEDNTKVYIINKNVEGRFQVEIFDPTQSREDVGLKVFFKPGEIW